MRRRYLLDILKTGGLIPYSFSYLYYSLIPTSVNGRNVGNYLKITKVYGNSVVENQLADFTTDFGTKIVNGITIDTDLINKTIRYHGTATANASCGFITSSNNKDNLIVGHKYLIKFNKIGNSDNSVWSIVGLGGTNRTIQDGIYNGTSSSQYGQILIYNGKQVDFTIKYEIIDLTQMFPFDTPTTLDDVRIQALLNRGYIDYNSGEIKSVDISEFSSEPYNLFDDEWQLKTINPSTGQETDSDRGLSSVNHISVLPNTSYTLEDGNISGYSYKYFDYYDKDKNFISSVNTSISENMTQTTPNNCFYIKIYYLKPSGQSWEIPTNSQVCLHRTGTRTGYAPYTQPQTLPFIYQGNGAGTSHDTFEITSSEYVFTKNNAFADLHTLSFGGVGNNVYYATLPTAKADTGQGNMPKILCDKYEVISAISGGAWQSETRDKVISLGYDTARVYVRDTSITQASDIIGTLQYELATPQVIHIPKKHLGIVDLGSLNWTYQSNNGRWYSNGIQSSVKVPINDAQTPNMYNKNYMTKSYNNKQNGYIYLSTGGTLFVYTTDSVNMPTGYLFYETESEVADIETQIQVEAGGTITSDSDVLPSIDGKFYPKGIILLDNALITSDGNFLCDSSNNFIITTESI